MDCTRQGCTCVVGEKRFELDGQTYCCEKCARECTDGNCQCTSSDCH